MLQSIISFVKDFVADFVATPVNDPLFRIAKEDPLFFAAIIALCAFLLFFACYIAYIDKH